MSKNGVKQSGKNLKMNFSALREMFPIFNQKVNGFPFIFFDSASTAQMPQVVLDNIVSYYLEYKSNIGRGVYTFAEKATAAYEDARYKVAHFIGAKSKEIVFTSGATESINIVVRSWAFCNLQQGDEIMVSAIEHHSNFVPWQQLALSKGLNLTMLPVSLTGNIDIDVFKKHLSSKTKLVAIVHTSNILGTTNDIETMTKMAHEVGAKVLIDASQSIAHRSIDIKKIGCDFLVFSGHKLFGPTGVGVLFVKESIISQMTITSFGGGMVFSVGEKESSFRSFPHSFEAGTPQVAQVIGLGACIDFIKERVNFTELQEHEALLTSILYNGLKTIDDIELVSPLNSDGSMPGSIVTFYSKTHHAHDIAAYLDRFGIAVRAGHHCVQLYHQKCGINASVRVSFSLYNTAAEVEFFLESLKQLIS